MPLYEYKCRDCGNRFEELVGKTVPEITPLCPKCQSDNCERLISTFAAAVGKSSSPAPCGSAKGCGRGGFS